MIGQILAALPGAISLAERLIVALESRHGATPEEARAAAALALARIRAAREARKR